MHTRSFRQVSAIPEISPAAVHKPVYVRYNPLRSEQQIMLPAIAIAGRAAALAGGCGGVGVTAAAAAATATTRRCWQQLRCSGLSTTAAARAAAAVEPHKQEYKVNG